MSNTPEQIRAELAERASKAFQLGPWYIYQTCAACPVQYEGIHHDGSGVYFRARWSAWTVCVADSLDAAIDADGPDDPGVRVYREGRVGETEPVIVADTGEPFTINGEVYRIGYAASWMEHAHAERYVMAALLEDDHARHPIR